MSSHHQQRQQNKPVPRFREMSWLDPKQASNAAASKPLLSPSALSKTKARGVKPYTKELHSRFSSVGTHLHTKDQKPVASCGLSHDESMALMAGGKPTLSVRRDANLGGTERRFHGKQTHFKSLEGRGEMLGQENVLVNEVRGNATMPKSNWLKNLWMVSGTALEDREMQQCEAVIAPVLPVHDNWLEAPVTSNATTTGSGTAAVSVMHKDRAQRFTYQKPSKLINLEYDTAAAAPTIGSNNMNNQRGPGAMSRRDKHSRFSMVGGVHHMPS